VSKPNCLHLNELNAYLIGAINLIAGHFGFPMIVWLPHEVGMKEMA
jgi:hypothetical protein